MQKIIVETQLVEREDEFKVLSLGYATGLPVLLVGPKGVGKSQCASEFASAIGGRIFSYTLIAQSNPADLRGRLDIKKYLEMGEVDYLVPISEAEVVFLDEIDKASADVKNFLLDLLANREIRRGDKIYRANYRLLIGACNSIPEWEIDSPFWDRFIIRWKVEPVSPQALLSNGVQKVELSIPEPQEIEKKRDEIIRRHNMFLLQMVSRLREYKVSDRSIYRWVHILLPTTVMLEGKFLDGVMKSLYLLVGEAAKGVLPKSDSINKVISLAKEGKMSEALKVFESMNDVEKALVADYFDDEWDE